jgi:hypothetical protein
MVMDRFIIIWLSCAGNIVFGNVAVSLFRLPRTWLGFTAEGADKLEMITKQELINDL